jgi:L-iditol 2-dehydrogenase
MPCTVKEGMGMNALVKLAPGPGNVELREVEDPKPGRGQVKVAVSYAGVCGTDLRIRDGVAPSNPPVILGHEFSGTVCELGEGVCGFSVGDRVVCETVAVVCGSCRFCCTGEYMMCEDRRSVGYGVDGGFADFCVTRSEALHKLPGEVTLEQGALAEPLAVAVHAVTERADVSMGDYVLVSGAGTIGVLAAFVAKRAGAFVILAGTSCDYDRLRIGMEIGADMVVNVEDQALHSVVNDVTAGCGVDVAFECAGNIASITQCVQCLRKQGTLTQVGLVETQVPVNFDDLSRRELKLIGSFGHRWVSWEAAVELLRRFGDVLGNVISTRHPLEEWETAFEEIESRAALKVLLYPGH